jgi:arylsulfatase A-like enzyme
MKRFYLLAALVIGVSAAFIFYFHGRRPKPANVVFISIDTLRSDHCSVYGYHRKTTPRMDAFAGQGVRFEQAYAPMATTAGSHATMFTSKYPISHGVVKNGFSLHPDFTTLAEFFKKEHYETAAIVSSFVLDSKFGLDQGFDFYDDRFEPKSASVRWTRWQKNTVQDGFDRRAAATSERAIQWISQNRKQPFFLWIHFFDPHSPYDPVSPFRSRFSDPNQDHLQQRIAAYDEEILSVDYEVGRILDRLDEKDLAKNTLVVITADHGEGLMQHGRMGHGRHLYEEAVKVPLIFRQPGRIPTQRVVAEPVELVDLTVTILQLTGATSAANVSFDGVNLTSAILENENLKTGRNIFLQRRAYESQKGDKFGIRRDNWKYIESPEEGVHELFDLGKDPREMTNLHDEFPDQAQLLASSLEGWRKVHSGNVKTQKKLSEEDEERLKALGYVQ